jgi:putative ABC transport system permease protein
VKAALYLHYTARSLARGGQRTLLAVFCVAVGVMAIVALQLVGLMINGAFDSNVRDVNGGDIAVTSQNRPFTQDDLAFFARLKRDDTITNYTATINAQGSTGSQAALRQSFSVRIVDPATYPIVTAPTFSQPLHGSIASLLGRGRVIVTQPFIDQYHKLVGDSFDIHTSSRRGSGRVLHVSIAGIVTDSGVFAQAGSVVLLARDDYQAAAPQQLLLYDTIDVTTADQAHTRQAMKQIQANFPIANMQTPDEAVRQQQDTIDNIKKFLEISGLMALLIGGVGIVNTMQVLLSRRKTEIAMLKTMGYRRVDLYLLFGLEACALGCVGGILGAAAAIGVSYLVRNLVEQTFALNIPFVLDWLTIGGGIIIGMATALIFGLLPIVQAATIRPLSVLRDLPEKRTSSYFILSASLLLLLSLLFCALAIIILNNDILLGVVSVYGTFIFLGVLSLLFGLVILLVSKFPVPERLSPLSIVLALLSVIAGILLMRVPPGNVPAWIFLALRMGGLLLLTITLLSLIITLLPRPWKATTKMALRNLSRQRVRTTTTMLALFVGIFTIGLILTLGQDLREQVNITIANTLNYNVVVLTSNNDTATLQGKLASLPGLVAFQHRMLASTTPLAVNGKALQSLLPTGEKAASSSSSVGRGGVMYFLSGIEGYDVGNNQLPSKRYFQIVAGRNLAPDDAGTDRVLIAAQLANLGPLHLKVGDRVTLAGIDRLSTRAVTIVGVYRARGYGENLYPMLGTTDTVGALSPQGLMQSVFYMKIDPARLNSAVDVIGKTVPGAFIVNLVSIGDFINQLLNDILLTLTTIASLSLLAGLIIIANAVALAMLERRRELGILKAVGYTRSLLLGEVLLENGLIGGIGAFLSLLLVAGVVALIGPLYFKLVLSVDLLTAITLMAGAVVLAMLIAGLVAWSAVRARPLEVLRLE